MNNAKIVMSNRDMALSSGMETKPGMVAEEKENYYLNFAGYLVI